MAVNWAPWFVVKKGTILKLIARTKDFGSIELAELPERGKVILLFPLDDEDEAYAKSALYEAKRTGNYGEVMHGT